MAHCITALKPEGERLISGELVTSHGCERKGGTANICVMNQDFLGTVSWDSVRVFFLLSVSHLSCFAITVYLSSLPWVVAAQHHLQQ